MAISEKNAALVLKESELNDKFEAEFSALLESETTRKLLSENIKELAKPNATQEIVAEIEKLLNNAP